MLTSQTTTFVVLRGEFADRATAVAREYIALDRFRRRILIPGDGGYPPNDQIRRSRPRYLAVKTSRGVRRFRDTSEKTAAAEGLRAYSQRAGDVSRLGNLLRHYGAKADHFSALGEHDL